MATYDELLAAQQDDGLRRRTRIAVVVAAEVIRTEVNTTPNHVNRLAWAKKVYMDPDAWVEPVLWAVLAQNKLSTLAQITSATDSTLQNAVNAAIDVFAQ